MTKALLALGSNLGNRLGYLRDAVRALGDSVAAVSKIYETPPWPAGENAPMYLNGVILVSDTKFDARDWLKRVHELEQAAGRERHPSRQYAPRTLDVDVIMVWDEAAKPIISNDKELTLPHPQAYLRAFVLRPWLDIQPEGEIPGYGKLADLLQSDAIVSDFQKTRPISESF